MRPWIFIIAAFALLSPSFSICSESDPIIVRLATETPLMPIYIAKIDKEETLLDPSYLQQIENILHFDFHANGMTRVVKNTSEKDQRVKKAFSLASDEIAKWQAENLYYIIKPVLKGTSFKIQVLALNSLEIKATEPLSLKGQLSEDRKQIHKLSDTVFKSLFGKDGIATSHILYTVKHQTKGEHYISEVWEADYDGANAHAITQENALCVTPVYLPPAPGFIASHFMYVSYKNGQPKVFLKPLKGGTSKRLSTLKGNQLMPVVSRQRDQVALISDISGNPDLFLLSFSPETGTLGKPRQIFAAPHATQGSPTFSPDGSRIAFVSNKDSVPKIYVMDVPSANVKNIRDIKTTLINKQSRECTAPSWSPDGTKIAYTAMTSGTRQIWIYDFTTRQERQLTQGAGHKENPSWGPDSLHLTFNTSHKEQCDVYIMNLNQAEAFKVTSGSGDKRFPNWEPR